VTRGNERVKSFYYQKYILQNKGGYQKHNRKIVYRIADQNKY